MEQRKEKASPLEDSQAQYKNLNNSIKHFIQFVLLLSLAWLKITSKKRSDLF